MLSESHIVLWVDVNWKSNAENKILNMNFYDVFINLIMRKSKENNGYYCFITILVYSNENNKELIYIDIMISFYYSLIYFHWEVYL